MKSLTKYMMIAVAVLSANISNAQFKNEKSERVKILGNCGMCENVIEKAGNAKKTAKVDWDQSTQTAILTYDSEKTNTAEILKRIALAGYDNEQFLAPDDVYSKLHSCCKYERDEKIVVVAKENHSAHHASTTTEHKAANELSAIFDSYFSLKDALVKSDAKAATVAAKLLGEAVGKVDMNKLNHNDHTVWMKVMNGLSTEVKQVVSAKSIDAQRKIFISLSKDFYELAKVTKMDTPIYYQNCPMYNDGKGANWLSKESAIKNPFYGSQMLTCGSTVETIK